MGFVITLDKVHHQVRSDSRQGAIVKVCVIAKTILLCLKKDVVDSGIKVSSFTNSLLMLFQGRAMMKVDHVGLRD